MSNVAILIALFTAAQNPTPRNCEVLYRALADSTIKYHVNSKPGDDITFDRDLTMIKEFGATKCKLPKGKI